MNSLTLRAVRPAAITLGFLVMASPALAQAGGGGGGDVFSAVVDFIMGNWMRGIVMVVALFALIMLLTNNLRMGFGLCILGACGGIAALDALVGLAGF